MRSGYDDREGVGVLSWIFIAFAVLFYPILLSIYTLLPPLIGIAGLVIIYNINKNIVYTMAAFSYLIHLDLNLALPLMLSLFSIVIIHMLIYPTAKLMIRCKSCLAVFLIILIDTFYYMNLFLYDFMLHSKTILADSILFFYILMDIIIGLLL